ncbi:MAG: transposase [Saprospiraceae bacterium]|nr:transposase [Saprospiraceae bacterium]
MKRKRFSEDQIVKALREADGGRATKDICRELGISTATFYNWRKKYLNMDVSQLKRLKELEAENRKLKQMYADQALDIVMLKDVLSKKF